MLPFDFIVKGVPVSLQAKNRKRLAAWRRKVRKEAELRWTAGLLPLKDQLQLDITFFYESVAFVDVDNMIKPIQDALIGLLYEDDNQITDVHGRKRDISATFIIESVSPALVQGIKSDKEFIYVRVSSSPDQTRLKYD